MLPKLNESSYDLVIIDADFTNVQAYVDHALTLVKPRGSVIVAGALADDLVSDPAKRDDRTSAYRWLLKALEDREDVSPRPQHGRRWACSHRPSALEAFQTYCPSAPRERIV